MVSRECLSEHALHSFSPGSQNRAGRVAGEDVKSLQATCPPRFCEPGL